MSCHAPTPWILSTATAIALLLAGALATEARAEPAEVDSPAVVVEAEIPKGDEIEERIQAQLLADLEGQDLSTPDGRPLRVTIAATSDGSTAFTVLVTYDAKSMFRATCHCAALELQERLPRYTLEALERVRAEDRKAQRKEATPIVATADPEPQAPESTELEDERFTRGLWIYGSGIVVSGVGALGLVGGATAMVSYAAQKKNIRPWAVASTAAGLAGLAIGIPLWIVGDRRTRYGYSASLRLYPFGRGLALRGRF